MLVEPVDGWCGDAVPVVGGGGDAGEVADESVYVVLEVWCEALELAEFVECGEEDPVFVDVGCVFVVADFDGDGEPLVSA